MRKYEGKKLIPRLVNTLKGGRATKKISCSDKTSEIKIRATPNYWRYDKD